MLAAPRGGHASVSSPHLMDIVQASAVQTLLGQTMGTTWSVKLVLAADRDLHVLHDGIQARLDEIVAQMSTWEADSDISRYNRGEPDSWHALPDDFAKVLSCALEIAHASQGAFDPTIGPLVDAWGFGPEAGDRLPPAHNDMLAAQQRLGWQRIQLRSMPAAVLQPGGLGLDLSAIAKGYGVDAVAEYLRQKQIASALVEVGGELYGYGRKPDGQPWQVLVEASPEEDEAESPLVIALDDLAVATSGDYWHWFEHEGQRHAHTMDPRTAQPVAHAPAAVTVIAAHAMHADAWATALTVLGRERGIAFAEEHALAVRFVSRDGDNTQIAISSAFAQRLS